MKLRFLLLPLFLALTACASNKLTSSQGYGTLQAAFPAPMWEMKEEATGERSRLNFNCSALRCNDPAIVVLSRVDRKSENILTTEDAVRYSITAGKFREIISAGLTSNTQSSSIKLTSVTKIETTPVGFRFTAVIKTADVTLYLSGEMRVRENSVLYTSSVAKSPKTSMSNLLRIPSNALLSGGNS